MQSDWSEIPLRLWLKIQSLNFVMYLAGILLRSFFLALLVFGFVSMRYRVWIGVFPAVIALVVMWLDAQTACDPKEWLKAKSHILN